MCCQHDGSYCQILLCNTGQHPPHLIGIVWRIVDHHAVADQHADISIVLNLMAVDLGRIGERPQSWPADDIAIVCQHLHCLADCWPAYAESAGKFQNRWNLDGTISGLLDNIQHITADFHVYRNGGVLFFHD